MRNGSYIDWYLAGMQSITEAISRETIDELIEVLFDVYRRGNTIWIAGNGGSASTASHFACDLAKATISPGKPRVKAVSLADNVPLVSALTNDNGWDEVYVEQLRSFMVAGDAVVGISVHGGSGSDRAGVWSQNLLRALDYAKSNGAIAIGMAGFDGGAMKQLCDYCLVVPFDTTPHVESYHVAVHHLIAFCLADKIAKMEDSR